MSRIQVEHTYALAPDTLRAARELLDEVFDDLDEHDWEHALGGVHALAWEDATLVGHASVVQRRLLHGGRALRCGYVEAVAVRRRWRGRGFGAALMDAIEGVIRGAYELGALGATDEAAGFYGARGWRAWEGTTWALTPSGRVRTADDDDGLYVLPVTATLELGGELTCGWRDGAVW